MAENASVVISAGTVAEDYCFTTYQQLLTDFAALLSAYVPGQYNFFNYGDSEPAVEDRSKPWLRTVAGVPERWYVYSGGNWIWPHEVPASGKERRIWVGTLTELKTYDGGEDTAITSTTGPFWEEDTDFAGRSPMGVGTIPSRTISPTSIAVGDNVGAGEHALTRAQLPTDKIELLGDESKSSSGSPANANDSIARQLNAGSSSDYALQSSTLAATVGKSAALGSGEKHNIVHPVRGVYFIKRSARVYRRAT